MSISVSDRYGRKKVLLATMVGNIISALIWLQSTTFVSPACGLEGANRALIPALSFSQSSYMLSRLVGGLSEGNVQLSTYVPLKCQVLVAAS